QHELDAERGGRRLSRMVVRRGTDAAAAEDGVLGGEGSAQQSGDCRAVVADEMRPCQCEPAAAQHLDDARKMAVLALARDDLVADDDQSETHAGGTSFDVRCCRSSASE